CLTMKPTARPCCASATPVILRTSTIDSKVHFAIGLGELASPGASSVLGRRSAVPSLYRSWQAPPGAAPEELCAARSASATTAGVSPFMDGPHLMDVSIHYVHTRKSRHGTARSPALRQAREGRREFLQVV